MIQWSLEFPALIPRAPAVSVTVHLTTDGCYQFLLTKFEISTWEVFNLHGTIHKGLSGILVISTVLSQHISILFKESWKIDELMVSLVWQTYHSLKSRFIDIWPLLRSFQDSLSTCLLSENFIVGGVQILIISFSSCSFTTQEKVFKLLPSLAISIPFLRPYISSDSLAAYNGVSLF